MRSGSKSGTNTEPRTTPIGRCPLCGTRVARFLFSTWDRLHGIPGAYTYSRCISCRTVFQDPQVVPEDLDLCYPSDYYTHSPSIDPGGKHEPGARWDRPAVSLELLRDAIVCSVRCRPLKGFSGLVGRVLAKSRLLRQRAFHNLIDELIPRASVSLRAIDVGCGEGSLLTALQRAGWEVTGVERDPRAAEVARRQSGGSVYVGDFRQIDLPRSAYNLVVMSHVFEHLGDPISSLRRLKELLAPGGRIVLLYPNPESLGARIFREAWFPWEAPRHLVLPPSSALSREIHRAGLAVERIRTTARFAPIFIARSRKYRSGSPGEAIDSSVGVRDLGIGLLESVLVRLGFDIGEEVVASLVKPASPKVKDSPAAGL